MASATVASASSASRDWSTYIGTTVSPTLMVPLSGSSCPMIMRNRVDLPTPFAPTMPTTAPGGTEKLTPSSRARPPWDLHRSATSTTTSPRRGPVGIAMASRVSADRAASAAADTRSSYLRSRALPFLACPLAFDRMNSSSASSARARLAEVRASDWRRAARRASHSE